MEVQILSTAPFLYSRLFPKDAVVVERQTRHFEGVVGEIPYGFKSHRPHQIVNADVVLRHDVFLIVINECRPMKIRKEEPILAIVGMKHGLFLILCMGTVFCHNSNKYVK